MTDIASTAALLAQLLEAGTVARLDLLDKALNQAEQRGAARERARIATDLQHTTPSFITDLANQQ